MSTPTVAVNNTNEYWIYMLDHHGEHTMTREIKGGDVEILEWAKRSIRKYNAVITGVNLKICIRRGGHKGEMIFLDDCIAYWEREKAKAAAAAQDK